jgi:hypothetical protein
MMNNQNATELKKKETMTPYYKTKKQTTHNNPSHNMTQKQKKIIRRTRNHKKNEK